MSQKISSSVTFLKKSKTSCPYLAGKEFTVSHFLYNDYSDQEIDELLSRGYRHFTYYFFRPECSGCGECVPIRLNISGYSETKSIRRIINKNSDLEIRDNGSADKEHFELYLKHKLRFGESEISGYDEFADNFFSSNELTRACDYYLDGRLICCSHYDIGKESLSAVYTYYDTGEEKRSLGYFAVYNLINIARQQNKKFLYLGFYIKDNQHMNYKIRMYPNQLASKPCIWHDYKDSAGKIVHEGDVIFKALEQ